MASHEGMFKGPDGNQTAYQVWGNEHNNSTPLVLITGMSAVMADWSPLVDPLAKKRKVLIMDHRGIGGSKVPSDWDEDLSLEIEARDALAVVKHLGKPFQKISLLGWSMGGHIAQVLLTYPEAKEHPKGGLDVLGIHIESVILAATMTKLPKGDFTLEVLEEIMQNAATDPDWKIKVAKVMMEFQYDPKWLAASSENKDLFDRRVDISVNARRPQKIFSYQIAAISQVDTRSDLARIPQSLPVLVIHGKLDRMVAYSESNEILKHIKHAKRFDPGDKGDQYAHYWFDYYGTQWWADQIEQYLSSSSGPHQARL